MKIFLLLFFAISLLFLTDYSYSQGLSQTIENHGEMVLVPEGEFLMGTDPKEIENNIDILGGMKEWYVLEIPKHKVTLKSFYIDKYEVTNSQYCDFLNQKGNQEEDNKQWIQISNRTCLIYQDPSDKFKPKEGYENYPVVMVTWYGARAYARWSGKRLPTEAEWEKASRGEKGFMWPWGKTWDENKCNNWNMKIPELLKIMPDLYNHRGPLPGGSFPKGASPYGAMDMIGNASEWCTGWYGFYQGFPYSTEKDYYYKSTFRVVRGGSWGLDMAGPLRCAARSLKRPFTADSYTGFRCAMDVPVK